MTTNQLSDNLVSDKHDYLIVNWPTGKLHDTRFPYAVVRVAYGVFAPIAVPSELSSREEISQWIAALAAQHSVKACLVVDKDTGIYFNKDGTYAETNKPPSGGNLVNWHAFLDGRIDKIYNLDTTVFLVKNTDATFAMIITKPE